MQKKIIATLIFLFFCIFVNAQEEKKRMGYSGFSGGMMLHLGYVQSGNFTFTSSSGFSETMQLSGLAFGIGGQLRVCFGEHLRIGGEGYVSEHKYKNSSYTSIGWGGFLADCVWEIGKFSPFIGGTVGGGSQKNVTNFSAQKNDYNLDNIVSFRKYGFVCIVPFIGLEYALSTKIHLIFKIDYIFNVSNPQKDFTTGPRFYFGFSFCR